MHEMQNIVTDDRGVCPWVCQSVCHAVQLGRSAAHAVCAGSLDVAFAKSLWPLVFYLNYVQLLYEYQPLNAQ